MIIDKIGKYLQSGRSWYTRKTSNIEKIVVHHSAFPHSNKLDSQILNDLFNVHKNKGWPGLSYHFVIPESGYIYQINKLSWITWHDSVNDNSIGICLNGYFHPNHNNKPTSEQLESLRWLLDNLCTKHPEFPADQNDVYGHRDIKATSCPGDNLYPFIADYRWGNDWPEEEPAIDLLAYLGVYSEDEAKVKLKEHLGEKDDKCLWGDNSYGGGGHLGSERTKVKRMIDQLKEWEKVFSNMREVSIKSHN